MVNKLLCLSLSISLFLLLLLLLLLLLRLWASRPANKGLPSLLAVSSEGAIQTLDHMWGGVPKLQKGLFELPS